MSQRVKSFEDLPEILTVNELQSVLGVSRVTAYQLVHQNGFPSFRLGRALRIPKRALLDWLAQQTN
ncbi:helix-turn-helix domain-containing protein [Neomoorella humiferrea]|uniref:helix-turn-helix domain-containing protein n=1 Tax=Neomoorella humiferrea TaxID=676965 RepID=UPI003D8B6FC7